MTNETIGHEIRTPNENALNQADEKLPIRVGKSLGKDFLLTKEDVASIARCGDDVARDLIHETSKGFKAHTKLYVFDSDLYDYFKSLRGNLK